MLKKFIKMNPHDYLLTIDGKQLSSTQLTRIYNKIFNGKNVSISMIRHAVLTHFYKDMPPLTQMETQATNLGHSVLQALKYVKRKKE